MRPSRREPANYAPRNNSRLNHHRQSFYNFPNPPPPTHRRYYSNSVYNTNRPRFRHIPTSPMPDVSNRGRSSSMKRNSPIITEVQSDEPDSFQSRSEPHRDREPESLDSIRSNALIPSKAIESGTKFVVKAEVIPPPIPPPPPPPQPSGQKRMRRMSGESRRTSASDFYGLYDAMNFAPSTVSVQAGTDVGTQYPAIDYIVDTGRQSRVSTHSNLPRPVGVHSRTRNGHKSSSGSEAGRSFDETLVQQSVKFYSTSSQCYFSDTKERNSAIEDENHSTGSHATFSVKSHRVKSYTGIPTKYGTGLRSKHNSVTRTTESDGESFAPVVISAVPKLSYRDRTSSGESTELLISRSFATADSKRNPYKGHVPTSMQRKPPSHNCLQTKR